MSIYYNSITSEHFIVTLGNVSLADSVLAIIQQHWFFYPLADELQSRFPGVKFIKARNLDDYFPEDTGSTPSE